MSKFINFIKRQLYILKSKLWFNPLAYCILAILAIYWCYLMQQLNIDFYSTKINLDTVNSLLSIITTSMLAVIVFTVGAIVTAYNSASNSGTPRVLTILFRDKASHKATSNFIGAFIYGVVATVGIKSGVFNGTGIFLIFLITIFVFAWVIFTFIIWIDDIAKLGQVRTLLTKTEKQAFNAVKKYTNNPYLGCNALDENSIPTNSTPIFAQDYGFLNDILFESLNSLCKELDAKLYIVKYKGEHLASTETLAFIECSKDLPNEKLAEIANHFIISNEKNFIEDPVFGLETLSEIAAKALSPSTNDPTTAINVIDTLNRCLKYLFDSSFKDKKVIYENLYIKDISIERFIKSSFEYIRIYGSSNLLVAKRIQKSLLHISKQANKENSKVIEKYMENCYTQANVELTYNFEKTELNEFIKSLKVQK
ncbi:DUF2254 domain-containing protein [Candidatus Francisella endociliophora]|uniref:DUF2254 domain-containing protein n=1 Tax=Candidatus Francisella endociliophora TaxID=653937 RepID=UPI0009DD0635|nr:DUF2254 domain-containing protein [Francisella sp. FSC1006]